jgi:hypothetical protein
MFLALIVVYFRFKQNFHSATFSFFSLSFPYFSFENYHYVLQFFYRSYTKYVIYEPKTKENRSIAVFSYIVNYI